MCLSRLSSVVCPEVPEVGEVGTQLLFSQCSFAAALEKKLNVNFFFVFRYNISQKVDWKRKTRENELIWIFVIDFCWILWFSCFEWAPFRWEEAKDKKVAVKRPKILNPYPFGLRQDGDSGGDTVDLAYIKHYIEDILPKNFDNDHRLLNLFLLQL